MLELGDGNSNRSQELIPVKKSTSPKRLGWEKHNAVRHDLISGLQQLKTNETRHILWFAFLLLFGIARIGECFPSISMSSETVSFLLDHNWNEILPILIIPDWSSYILRNIKCLIYTRPMSNETVSFQVDDN